MKVFFDTNVYVAEALLGRSAEAMLKSTVDASWRIFISARVLDEVERVLGQYLGCSNRFARLTRQRCRRRAIRVRERPSRHEVPDDAADSPILRDAIEAGVDYLVTNDDHLLKLNPYEGLKVVSMTEYHDLLVHTGLLRS